MIPARGDRTPSAEPTGLLPALAARVALVLAGEAPPPAPWHRLYVVLETIKLLALLLVAWSPRRGRG